MQQTHETVFIYGSLKRGFPYHHHMKNCTFVRSATTETLFSLQVVTDPEDTVTYPCIIENGNSKIKGELFSIPIAELDHIDEFEETGLQYDRKKITIDDGPTVWAYVFINKKKLDTYTDQERIRFSKDNTVAEWV